MRTTALFLANVLGRASRHAKPPVFRLLAHAKYVQSAYPEPVGDQARLIVPKDEATYRSTWKSLIDDGSAPPVDFARETPVFLFLGWKPTGGWDVEPVAVSADKETIVVTAKVIGPKARQIVTEALTSPYAVIAVDRTRLVQVRWNDESGNTIAVAKP